MRTSLAQCLRQNGQPAAALDVVNHSIAQSASFASSDREHIPTVHMLVIQYEAKSQILDDLKRHDDAKSARDNVKKLRESL